jgi:hypothetical protein
MIIFKTYGIYTPEAMSDNARTIREMGNEMIKTWRSDNMERDEENHLYEAKIYIKGVRHEVP